MKQISISQVLLAAIFSGTAIFMTAIALNFTGVIELSWTKDGLQLRLLSQAHSLPSSNDASVDAL